MADARAVISKARSGERGSLLFLILSRKPAASFWMDLLTLSPSSPMAFLSGAADIVGVEY